ncbi:MAG TPA: adenine deaminase, partial [Flavisolibacter sp.]|nr:adenine deaminase [Flavisolibacter sp.]
MNETLIIRGKLVDVHAKQIYAAEIMVEKERIVAIKKVDEQAAEGKDFNHFIIPGFIDSHVHIESSMIIPSEFARLAVVHGTVGTVSDPHEIANVCGMKGIDFMIENGKTVPFKFNFGAPSCVPATSFETAGATIDAEAIDLLMRRDEILYLSEMMNFPGVLNGDEEVLEKIKTSHKYNKPVDGHAPGLMGESASKYINAGISTDHECFTKEEALDKLERGMKILIREGSAARNFDALIDLLPDFPDKMMFCSDDKHPDSLVHGHINLLCQRAAARGIDVFTILAAACVNPVAHYKLKVGLLRLNDFADFLLVKDLTNFEVLQTYVNGVLVAEDGKSLIEPNKSAVVAEVNNFNCSKKTVGDFSMDLPIQGSAIPVIEALDGQLITNAFTVPADDFLEGGNGNIEKDILKIVVVNRYNDTPVAKAWIKGFGLKQGALASSVAHDSHNIVAVGTDDESICKAVNLVIEKKGGVSLASANQELIIALPIGGLMSADDGYSIAEQYSAIDKAAKSLGSTLGAPYMTLS